MKLGATRTIAVENNIPKEEINPGATLSKQFGISEEDDLITINAKLNRVSESTLILETNIGDMPQIEESSVVVANFPSFGYDYIDLPVGHPQL